MAADPFKLLMYDLNTIGTIREGDKLVTSGEFIAIEPNDVLQPLRRWWNNEDRLRAVEKIRRICMMVALLADVAASGDAYTWQMNELYDGLERARKGIKNLMQTYRDDANATGKLKLSLEIIRRLQAAD